MILNTYNPVDFNEIIMPGTKPLWWLIREGKLDEYVRAKSLSDLTAVGEPTAKTQETQKLKGVSVTQSSEADTFGDVITNEPLPTGLETAIIKYVSGRVASLNIAGDEMVTIEYAATFSDGTKSANPLEKEVSANSSHTLSGAEMNGILDTGKTVTGISVRAKSNIGDSNAVITFDYTLIAEV